MSDEAIERAAKVCYMQAHPTRAFSWDDVSPETRVQYRVRAQAVIAASGLLDALEQAETRARALAEERERASWRAVLALEQVAQLTAALEQIATEYRGQESDIARTALASVSIPNPEGT